MRYLRRMQMRLPSNFFLSYENIAFLMLLALVNSILYAYGQAYYYSQLSYIALYVSMGLALYIVIAEWRRSSASCLAIAVILLSIIASFWWLGYVCSTSVIHAYKAINVFYLNAEGTYTGHVTETPNIQKWEDKDVLQLTVALETVKPDKHNIGNKPIKAEGTVIVYVPLSNGHQKNISSRIQIKKHDSITFKGKVVPLQYSYEEGHIDLRSRHITNGIVGRVYDANLCTSKNKVSSENVKHKNLATVIMQPFDRVIYFAQDYINKTIEKQVSPQSAAILKTLVLGGNYADIDEIVMRSFAFTGLIHILSVSGSHVGILFSTIYLLAKVLGIRKKSYAPLAVIVVIFYALLVGFNAPIVRSAIMGVVTSLALMKGRTYMAKQALTLSAIGLLLLFPMQVLDISFQLSYLATYGLIFFSKSVGIYLYKLPPLIRYPLAMCFSAQLLVLPLQIYYFHFFSFLSFVAAIFVGPLLEFVILLLFTYIILSILYVPSFLWSFLELLLKVVLFGNITIASLPVGAFWVGMSGVTAACMYYVFLVLWHQLVIKAKNHNLEFSKRFTAMVMGILFLSLTANQWYPFLRNETRIHIVPLSNKQITIVRSCHFPHKEHVAVYMDIKKGTFTKKNVEDMKTALRYVGKNKVDEFVVINGGQDKICKQYLQELSQYWHTSIQSDSKNKVYLCLFRNRQNKQKNLKLNSELEQSEYLFGSNNVADVNKILLQDNPSSNIAFWPKRREQVLLDKECPNLYVVGAEWVPDFYL